MFSFMDGLSLFCSVMQLFCLMNQGRTKGEGWSTENKLKPLPPSPVVLLLAVPRRLFCFGSFGDFRCLGRKLKVGSCPDNDNSV